MTLKVFIGCAVIAFVATFLAFLVALTTGRGGRFAGVRPRPWHPVVRIACGAIAAAIMVAVTIATWPATSATAPEEGKPLVLLPPVATATAESPADNTSADDEEKPVRLIYTVMAVAIEGDAITPLDGTSVVINLPEDRHRQHVIEGTLPGGSFKAEVSVDGIERLGRNRQRVRGHHDLHYETDFGSSGMHGTSLSSEGTVQVDRITSQDRSAEHRPLSVVPDRVGAIAILSQLTKCPDEPPREVTGSAWLHENADHLRGAVNAGDFRASWRPQPQANGIEMVRYVGPASALLLLAAILASQVFRQRGMAFVAAMTVAVLFALVMDRVMVERHAAWLASHPDDASSRANVVARMEQSFFHAARVKAILAATQP